MTIYNYLICLIIVINIYILFVFDSSIFLNINSFLTFIVWISCILIGSYTNKIYWVFVPLLLLLLNELSYIYFNIDIFDGGQRTALFYDITTTYFIKNSKKNTNLTEGIYLNDIKDDSSIMTIEDAKKLDPKIANNNKYIKLLNDLNIDKNDYPNIRLLDIGCGNGDFIKYCKSIGIKAIGLTISKNQSWNLSKQGYTAYYGSYRELQKKFINKFDIITCWGCLEHITNSYPCSKSGEKKAKDMLYKIMEYFKQYFKTDSKYKYFFNTTLHLNPKMCGTIDAYLIERSYAGWYFYDKEEETLGDLIKINGFKQIYNKDFTYHYYLASKVDPDHFGNPRTLDLYSIFLLFGSIFVNPQITAMLFYGLRGEWMWQFDGKQHYCETCYDCDFEDDRDERPTTLIWNLNKLN